MKRGGGGGRGVGGEGVGRGGRWRIEGWVGGGDGSGSRVDSRSRSCLFRRLDLTRVGNLVGEKGA